MEKPSRSLLTESRIKKFSGLSKLSWAIITLQHVISVSWAFSPSRVSRDSGGLSHRTTLKPVTTFYFLRSNHQRQCWKMKAYAVKRDPGTNHPNRQKALDHTLLARESHSICRNEKTYWPNSKSPHMSQRVKLLYTLPKLLLKHAKNDKEQRSARTAQPTPQAFWTETNKQLNCFTAGRYLINVDLHRPHWTQLQRYVSQNNGLVHKMWGQNLG